MAYEEPTLKQALYDILNGLQSEKNWRETGEGISRIADIIPNVTESLARGGIGQAIGTSGDLRELRNTVNSYLPKSVRNMTQAAEFLSNPYATAIQQTAPTTEDVLETVPRITDKYEGYKQHETLGEYIAPSLGYFGAKALKAGKDLPGGLSIMGPESKLWEPKMAFQAAKMEAKGVPAEEIKRATGMARGLDNQWRSELSDFWSQMKGDGTFGDIHGKVSADKEALIKDVFEHPELLEAYPHLGEIKVKTLPKDSPIKGAFNERKNEIHIREDLTPEQAKSTILHELTHGVQGIEGMNRGANYGILVKHFEKEKEGLFNQITDLNKQMEEAYKADDMDKYRQLIQSRDVLSRKYTQFDPEELGYDAYKHYAGEAEARLVQERAGMTPDQLRQTYPYQYGKGGLDINPDEAIITTKHPGTINTPEQSIEPPTSKKDELGFHSPLENAVFGIKQPKGTGEQFLKQLEKTPGVKTEELEYTGLKKYLQDNKFVTKQEVQDFIENNRLRLENKELGPAVEDTYGNYQLHGGDVYDDYDYINSVADDLRHDLINDPDLYHQTQQDLVDRFPELYEGHEFDPNVAKRLNDHVEEALAEQAKAQATDMYYENPITHHYDDYGYDVYGNDDMGYTFKDPQGRFLDIGGRNGVYDLSEAEDTLRQHLLDEGIIDIDGGGAKYEDYVLPGRHDNYREVLTTLPGNKTQDYSSGHFDEPNILAHMRVNDRTINGKKTLMVEEIQSDWHQEGRKKGYWTPANKEKMDELTKLQGSLHKEKMALRDEYKDALKRTVETETDPNVEALSKKLSDIEKQQVATQAEINKLGTTPDAPYKKTWHELMVKQALEMAAKGDYDAIAFTTGKQQADRYNLSKHIESLSYNPETNELLAYKEGGYGPIINKTVEPNKLSEYVGEEVAKRLLKKELESVPTSNGVVQLQQLSGLDLETGGEGMKGFYDKIIPDYINKYTKKWGMGMKKSNLGTDKFRQDLSDEELAKGLEHFGLDTKKFYQMSIGERSDTYEKISRELYPMKNNDDVHFIELSDAAKKDIKEKGQPMFAGIGALGGVDYLAGSDEQNKLGIFKDLQKAKK